MNGPARSSSAIEQLSTLPMCTRQSRNNPFVLRFWIHANYLSSSPTPHYAYAGIERQISETNGQHIKEQTIKAKQSTLNVSARRAARKRTKKSIFIFSSIQLVWPTIFSKRYCHNNRPIVETESGPFFFSPFWKKIIYSLACHPLWSCFCSFLSAVMKAC